MNTVHAHGGPLHEFESDPASYESPSIAQATPTEIGVVGGFFLLLLVATILLVRSKQK